MKDPPEHLQTECSICLCVLREPYLLDCCGYSFCKSCIEPIKAERKPCPLCAVQFTRYMPDKRLQRTLNDLQVYCAHKDEGCEWVGRLTNVAEHLNVNPLLERKRLSGCQLTSLECKHCGDCFERRALLNHETSVCSQRPYSCEYCQVFNSTFEDVTSNHLSVCPDRPVPCPNGCRSYLELKLLDNHLKECPLEVMECAFSYAGCIEKLPRKDMPEHITQNFAIHMSLQATSHQQEQQKLHHQISELQELHQQEVMKLNNQIIELQVIHQREVLRFNQRFAQLEELYKCSRAELAELRRANMNQVAAVGQEIKKAQDLRLKGHFGTLRGEIKTAQTETKQEITEQVKSDVIAVRGHIAKEIKRAQVEIKQEITKQVKSDVAAVHGHIAEEMKKARAETKQEITKQMKSDVADVRRHIAEEMNKGQSVMKQEITKQVKSDIAAVNGHIGLVPFCFTMPRFEMKRCSKSSWYSPSFYTHPHGYKMCLNVDANGYGIGANSHVSVFVYMMKGEYDDDLKWPFRGDITIQLLNQMRDDDHHHTRILSITDKLNLGGRVLTTERSVKELGFYTFIQYKDLVPLQHLKYDCLKFCVKEVIVKSV